MRALRDAGFEVIYTGRRQSSAQIAVAAIQESADLIGLSILSGSHVELCRRLFDELESRGAADIPVVVGGTIRPTDVPALDELGVAATFPTGTTIEQCIAGVTRVLSRQRTDTGADL
jgi:methylmalonyl-CoA mutase, C-terminal domain